MLYQKDMRLAGSELRIFLSYRRDDSAGHAGWLHEHLSKRLRCRIFMDGDNIPVGSDFARELERQIKASDVVLALIGKQWLTSADRAGRRRLDDPSDYVRLELENALAYNVRIIPVLLGNTPLPGKEELPASLQPLIERQAAALGEATFVRDARELSRKLQEVAAIIAKEQRLQAENEKREREAAKRLQRENSARASGRGSFVARLRSPWQWFRSKTSRYPVLQKPAVAVALASVLIATLGLAPLTYFYAQYSRLIDARLRAGPASSMTSLYAVPQIITVGDSGSPEDLARMLIRSGYSDSRQNDTGSFELRPDSLEIRPGRKSYFDSEPGIIKFSDGKIQKIISLSDNTQRGSYAIEPALITNLARQKRRPVRFGQIPSLLVHAVISAEDKRFFEHAGIDPLRVPGYLLRGFAKPASNPEKASVNPPQVSLTVALANLLRPHKQPGFGQRAKYLMAAAFLEQRLTKEEIFEFYANEVYLGRRGSFTIIGFGEAAQVYFGKTVAELTLPEAATLAGMAAAPDQYDPLQFPDRLRERRNVVLDLMRENGFIADRDRYLALESPVALARRDRESEEAPHFADLSNDWLQQRFAEEIREGTVNFRLHPYRVYTALDLNLQRLAVVTVNEGLGVADAGIATNRRWAGYPASQSALVALDPSTGYIKALVGGRDYQTNGVDQATTEHQPGAVFFPFDFAAALEASVSGSRRPFTLASPLTDEPRTFIWKDRLVPIPDFNALHRGRVAFADALADSLAAPALSVAETVGYDKVLALTQRSGLYVERKSAVAPAPNLALGFEEVSPLELAGAYTAFANGGVWVKPNFITLVRDETGRVVFHSKIEQRQAMDPRVAYMVADTLKRGVRSGGAKSVLAGLTGPAAVITGRSRSVWCVGFTTRLLVAVWVGYDDDREVPPEGATAALRIWAAFMNRASRLADYGGAPDFVAPPGIVFATIDGETGERARGSCPVPRVEAFITGTEPMEPCHIHTGKVLPLTSAPNSLGPRPLQKPAPSGQRRTKEM